jgi:chromate transporter
MSGAAVSPFREVAQLFLRLGLTAFGGPAAHIAAMEDEVVTRRAWLSRDEFADLVGATNLIPGPNSTELAIHLGYRRAGWPGLLAAGSCFVVPAVALVWGIAWLYVRFGTRVEVSAMLAGMQPAVLAVVVQAIWRLRASLVRSRAGAVLAVLACLGVLAGLSELVTIAAAVVLALAWGAWRTNGQAPPDARPDAPTPTTGRTVAGLLGLSLTGSGVASMSAGALFASFAKIGSVLFGSGYVLLTFLRGEFVTRLHLLTEPQLLDAIAIGQVTPGPVFSAATFVGYLLGGHAGAAAATAGIFLPAFVGVACTAPLVARLRRSRLLQHALDAVNAVSLALMATVVILMARALTIDAWTLVILLVASALLLLTRIGASWVLLGGALAGLLRLL